MTFCHNRECKGLAKEGSNFCSYNCAKIRACFEMRSQSEAYAVKVELDDMVKEPPHYKSVNPIRIDLNEKSYLSVPTGKLEALHVIEAFDLGWHAGNVLKYLLRAGRKGDALQDLRKAHSVLGRLIAFAEGRK